MNPSGTEILTNPQPSGHIVYPYTDEAHVADAVSLFATAGLRKGEAVLLIMASTHCELIRRGIESLGFDTAWLEAAGRLICEDAAELLSNFVFGGVVSLAGTKASDFPQALRACHTHAIS